GALGVLLLGHHRRDVLLMGLASAALLLFGAAFYYQLHLTLLAKAGVLCASGGVLLALRPILFRDRAPAVAAGRPAPVRPTLAVLASLGLVVGLVGGLALHKQHVLASGTSILLPLRPRDPRSLMQGDYMELRYNLGAALKPDAERAEVPADGRLVVAL